MQDFITIENENRLIVKGIKKVISSTPNQIAIQTSESTIIFSGSNFEVKKLDVENGEIAFEGNITNIKFNKKGEKQSFLKRIFK